MRRGYGRHLVSGTPWSGTVTYPPRFLALRRYGGLLVDDARGVHQRAHLILGAIGIELQHIQPALARDHHGLLGDDPLDAVLGVAAADLGRVEPAEGARASFFGSFVSGQVLDLTRGEFQDLGRVDVARQLDTSAMIVGGSWAIAGSLNRMAP